MFQLILNMKGQADEKSSGLKIIVYEHVSGGGYAGRSLPSGVLSEGFGMLRSFVADLKEAGHETTVLIDERLSKLNPPLEADCTVPILYPEEPKRFLTSISKINDAVFIIAPETGQTLQTMVEFVEHTGKVSLNCKSSVISKVADKAVLYESLQDKGFLVPKTLVLSLTDSLEKILTQLKKECAYPILFKPVDGVGCCGLSIVNNENQVGHALTKLKEASTSKRFIIQEFIKGDSASVSLISTGKKALALSLNKQSIVLSEPDAESSYSGGCVPFNHPLKEEAMVLAQKVVEAFPGLRGYVGVDLVLTKEAVFVVDVNPRLTTSYVGLRKVVGFNVAEALVNVMVKGELPKETENLGAVCFSKMETPTLALDTFQKVCKLNTVISPPFPLVNSSKTSVLVIGEGSTMDEARLRLEEAKNNLLNILS